jgi:hypothetical protein
VRPSSRGKHRQFICLSNALTCNFSPCALFALRFFAFAWALTQSAGTQVNQQVEQRIAEKDKSIAETIALFDKALTRSTAR